MKFKQILLSFKNLIINVSGKIKTIFKIDHKAMKSFEIRDFNLIMVLMRDEIINKVESQKINDSVNGKSQGNQIKIQRDYY